MPEVKHPGFTPFMWRGAMMYKCLRCQYDSGDEGRIKGHVKHAHGGPVALEDFDAAGALPSDSEDIINMALSVRGTEFAVIFVEQRTGGFKISFRSRCDVDCARIAELFGGGGHRKAAGAFIAGTLSDAQTLALDAVRAAMQ
jgi:phosphoesterase RecJ-like protein